MEDFKAFVAEAHRRGLRVITELVINHTSDQHPWFQRRGGAKPGSPARDIYVWTDTRPEVPRDPHHLPRHRAVELDAGIRWRTPSSGTASTRTSRT